MKFDVGQIFSFLKWVLGGFGLFSAHRAGKKSERLKAAEKKLDAINETNKIHDAVESDPEYRDRVHDHFNR